MGPWAGRYHGGMIEQLARLHGARPFVPFLIRLGPGRSRRIGAPERLARPASGGAIHIAGESGVETFGSGEITGLEVDTGGRAMTPLERVRLVAFDFDGVWSNNQVLVMQDGTEGVLCNRSDGLGLGMLRAAGMAMVVLSKEENPVVAARCRKLQIPCRQGLDDKLTVLAGIAADREITLAEVAYVGNDVNDVPCMRAVGVPIAVADAYPEAIAAAALLTGRRGGDGAVREVCGWFLGALGGS